MPEKVVYPISLSVGLASGLAVSVFGMSGAIAQITPALDGTGTNVFQDGNQFFINGGTLSVDGQNLFQSFESFGLEAGQIADFLAQPDVQNILGRVTGGDPSVIDGTLQVSGGAPNLFLMNPAGLVFGPHAQLNVPADFTATTATGIEFGESQWFQAIGENNYGQLNGAPTGFYLGNSGAVINSGNLAVGLGQHLSLIGTDVVNFGSLRASEGQLLLMALPDEGLLRVKLPGYSLGLDLGLTPDAVSRPTAWTLPVAALSDLLQLDAIQSSGVVAELAEQQGEQASAAIVTGLLDVSEEREGGRGGTVGILGDRVGLVGAGINASGTDGGGTVLIGGEFQGQGSLPTAERTGIDADTVIAADALVAGDGGRVIVWADDATQFGGGISARGGQAQGDGGFVEVSGKETLVYRGVTDVGSPVGEIGTLLLDPENIVIVDGNGGANDTEIDDNEILFGDSAGSTFTISETTLEAQNGNLVLEATNNIEIRDLSDNELTLTPGAGSVTFTANNAFIMDDEIDAISSVGRDLTITAGEIVAGNILADGFGSTIGAGSVTLTTTTGDLTVGSIRAIITNTDLPPDPMFNGGSITLNSAGSLTINADQNTTAQIPSDPLDPNSELGDRATGMASFSANGDAGAISLTAVDDINITCATDSCLASFAGGIENVDPRGNGADITITSQDGSISIQSSDRPGVTPDPGSIISLFSGTDLNFTAGDITLSAPNGNVFVEDGISGLTRSGESGDVTITAANFIETGFIETRSDNSGTVRLTTSSNDATNSGITTGNVVTGSNRRGDSIFILNAGPIDLRTAGNVQTGLINLQGNTTGGDLTIRGTNITTDDINLDSDDLAGDIQLIATGDVTIGDVNTGAVNAANNTISGLINISADGAVQTGSITSEGSVTGGNLSISGTDIATGDIQLSSQETAGTLQLTATGNITTTNLNTSSTNATAGSITLSAAGDVQTSTIIAEGNQGSDLTISGRDLTLGDIQLNAQQNGGDIQLSATGNITTNNLTTSSTNDAAGAITLTSSGNTQIGTVTAQGNLAGGDVAITATNITTGDIQLDAQQTGGSLQLAVTGNIQSDAINTGGTLNGGQVNLVTTTGDITATTIQTTSTTQTGGAIALSSPTNIQVTTLDTQGALGGGAVSLSAANVAADTIQAGSANGTGGTISINSSQSPQLNNLSAQGGQQGGTIDLTSDEALTLGDIQVNSPIQGGSVRLTSPDNIQVGLIDAQGGVNGGSVDVITEQLFQATDTFTDNNGILASISAAGGATDGQVVIRHDGGNQTIPFIVGDASVNGTAGAITTGANNSILPTRGFIGSYTQGDIQIITADFLDPETAEFPPSQEVTEIREQPFWLDEYFTRQFEDYMGQGNGVGNGIEVKSLDEIQQTLQKTREETGITPALIYVIFEPQSVMAEADDINELANRGERLRATPGDEDEIYLVLVPPEGNLVVRRANASDATRENAPDAISNFRKDILLGDGPFNPIENFAGHAHKLYQWFLEPLKPAIEANGVDNLVYIMEPGLRSAPLAALSAMHDGEDYTIRDYSIGLMPSFSLTDTRYQDIRNAQLRAMGISDFKDDASNLPSAQAEVETVSHIWPRSHPPLLNEDLTWRSLRQQSSSDPGILHLATHAKFDTDTPESSYIRLANDETISLAQLRDIGLPIELLVLSACETALDGNGYDAELGFGGLAVQTGVKSALASLWTVNDAGTFALMSTFYDQLRGNEKAVIKAEALRQAQLAMLDGKVRIEDGYLHYSEKTAPMRLPESLNNYLTSQSIDTINLAHPIHWAGFTMIGSPW
ncbi:MAG: filamentous hemagglutinin family N-terminal domain [Phormidesmis priestleyi Ana]|uniref:Filamentous hemagglutinin family N-terminal domain n=1 Tax=Phormidesmis priestleyi Ana TaxID=1666911 RepID=A0A0P8DB40_9CYAN|nr:MAG: filamentous hemagglutinin family N-terminal domain [Phormidesmis priestleyi Ana]